MRVVGGRRPAQHVEAGIVRGAKDLGEVLGAGLGLQVDLDADPRQHAGDRAGRSPRR